MNPVGDHRRGPGTRKLVVDLAVPVLAASLLLAGLVLASLPVSSRDVGWFAYAPLSQQAFQLQGLVMIGAEAWTGIAMISLGLLILAFWSGYRVGSRRRQARELP
jgi:heme/copper-type cytochrome/quinol oxidase subunit 1